MRHVSVGLMRMMIIDEVALPELAWQVDAVHWLVFSVAKSEVMKVQVKYGPI